LIKQRKGGENWETVNEAKSPSFPKLRKGREWSKGLQKEFERGGNKKAEKPMKAFFTGNPGKEKQRGKKEYSSIGSRKEEKGPRN